MVKEDKVMKKAEEEYGYLTGDAELKRLAWLRIKAIKDEAASRELGIEEGMKKGLKQGKIEFADKLIAEGIATHKIVELTGLTKEEIEKLEKEYPYLRGEEEEKRLAWLRIKAIKDEAASRELGIEEGMKKGLKQGKLEIAKNMIKKKMRIEDIVDITGLLIDEIEKIK